MNRILFLAVAAASVVCAERTCVAGDFDRRDLSIEQSSVASVQPHASGSLRVTAWVDDKANTYRIGEEVRLFVKPNKDAYVTVVSIGPSGSAVLLYPNAFQPSMEIPAGQTLEIPGKRAAAKIVVSGKPGFEFIRVVASVTPINDKLADWNVGSGPFPAIEGGARSVARDLQLIQSNEMAFYDKIIRTVDELGSEASHDGSDAPDADHIVSTTLPLATEPQADVRPPVLIAVDKRRYKTGDTVTMAVTTLEACYLWVVDISSDGSARMLFPNQIVQDNHVQSAQTILVSGGQSKVKVLAAAPAGQDSIFAICGRDSTSPWKGSANFSTMFSDLDRSDPLARALIATSTDLDQLAAVPSQFTWNEAKIEISE